MILKKNEIFTKIKRIKIAQPKQDEHQEKRFNPKAPKSVGFKTPNAEAEFPDAFIRSYFTKGARERREILQQIIMTGRNPIRVRY